MPELAACSCVAGTNGNGAIAAAVEPAADSVIRDIESANGRVVPQDQAAPDLTVRHSEEGQVRLEVGALEGHVSGDGSLAERT